MTNFCGCNWNVGSTCWAHGAADLLARLRATPGVSQETLARAEESARVSREALERAEARRA